MTATARAIRTLQAGYWENVLLIEVDGQPRVRKELHRLDAPWARNVFIREWHYLRELPDSMRPPFVSVLGQCDELLTDAPPPDRPLWFEMEYLDGFADVRALLAEDRIGQADAERIQDLLAGALVDGLYTLPGEPFDADRIVWSVIEQVHAFARDDPTLARFARAEALDINGKTVPNLNRTFPRARADGQARGQFQAAPSVRLHGDLFYENVLYRFDPPAIRLIDPVSVAGVSAGPVVFDRVKFASWISGELYAQRHGKFALTADPHANPPCVDYAWISGEPVLDGLGRLDLGSRVLAAMDALIGPTDEAQAVLEAYFNLAMVPNTPMPQRLLRYVRAAGHLARWG